MQDTVALLKCGDNLKEILREALKIIDGFGPLRSPFIVKPNICTGNDRTGCANIKADFVETLIGLALEEDEGLAIKIVESDSMSKYADKAYQKYGYRDLEWRFRNQGFDVSLINLSKSPLARIKHDGLYFKDPLLPKILAESGYTASIALAKTHSLTMITGALKNLFGLLPRKDQSYYHPNINEVILDLNRIKTPDLCLIDARIGLQGVISGEPKSIGAIILGKKPVSVDATMARVMGFNPERIRHLVDAEKHGLGSLHPKVLGDDIASLAVKFRTPSNLKSTAIIS